MIFHGKKLLLLIFSLFFSGGVTAACSTDIDMGNNKITNLAAPTNAQDMANKAYVDDFSNFSTYSGQSWSTDTAAVNVAWEVYKTKNEGSGFTCVANSSACTVNFTGTILVDYKVRSKNQSKSCTAYLYKNGAKYELVHTWVIAADTASVGIFFRNSITNGFGVVPVTSGDTIFIAGGGGANADNVCSTNDNYRRGGFQYTKLR